MRFRVGLLLKRRPGTHSLCRHSVCLVEERRLNCMCVLCSYQMKMTVTVRGSWAWYVVSIIRNTHLPYSVYKTLSCLTTIPFMSLISHCLSVLCVCAMMKSDEKWKVCKCAALFRLIVITWLTDITAPLPFQCHMFFSLKSMLLSS